MTLIENMETLAVKTAIGYLNKNLERNLPKLMCGGIRQPHEFKL